MWQCTGEGAHNFIKFIGLPLNSVFEFWKQVKPVFCFGHSHPFSWVTEWWKRWLKINPNKCWVLKTGGTHTFWMMKTENWVISLKTLLIQTSSYSHHMIVFPLNLVLKISSFSYMTHDFLGFSLIHLCRLLTINQCLFILVHDLWPFWLNWCPWASFFNEKPTLHRMDL